MTLDDVLVDLETHVYSHQERIAKLERAVRTLASALLDAQKRLAELESPRGAMPRSLGRLDADGRKA